MEEIVRSPFPPKLIYKPSERVLLVLFKRAIELAEKKEKEEKINN